MMQQDIRSTDLYEEAEALYRALRQPGSGLINDAAEINACPCGDRAVFTGTFAETLESRFTTRICEVDLPTGHLQVLTFGPNCDRSPKYSPDGATIAFLSDRHAAGDYQLYLLDLQTDAARPTPRVQGWVEYLHWSPDGARILLGIAGYGADTPGGQGAIASNKVSRPEPSWMPNVETGDEAFRWRHAWIFELATNSAQQITHFPDNIWEMTWCGDDAIVAIASPRPDEGSWYAARLHYIDLKTGQSHELHAPQVQIGWPAADPSGKKLAFVEALASDRGHVAGDLKLLDIHSGKIEDVRTANIDVTHVEWRSETNLLLAGLRDVESVTATLDVATKTLGETWASGEISTSGHGVKVSGFGQAGDCVLIGEGFAHAPEIASLRKGRYRTVRNLCPNYAEVMRGLAHIDSIKWVGSREVQIHGWLIQPADHAQPHAVVMQLHGGPTSNWRPSYLGRSRTAHLLLLLMRGFALFLPNPHGSAGRGQQFARDVQGDVGGADAVDCLAGLDHLVAMRLADPARLAVCGGSYGGYLASWLITQGDRFSAAISIAPISNFVTLRFISNTPQFVDLFLCDDVSNPTGRYFTRSPIMHAHHVKTPTLVICGALDRCTPPEEGMQLYNALREHGARSVLVTYPAEGHGIRDCPASIDVTARVAGWVVEHIAPRSGDTTAPRKPTDWLTALEKGFADV